jgi:3-methyladenine DNA glycosylase AlkD
MLNALREELHALADPAIAEHSARFFKTGPGEYGEGDVFLGIRVPHQRRLARKYRNLPLSDVRELLASQYHEERLTALFVMVMQFHGRRPEVRDDVFQAFMASIDRVNNWDLVDCSAEHILGGYLPAESTGILDELARAPGVWHRRIAIMATFHYIRKGVFGPTIRLAEMLLADKHDLIHKAVGWMLRETGKRDLALLEDFLQRNARVMPRTMLRYAIEKLPQERREFHMRRCSAGVELR